MKPPTFRIMFLPTTGIYDGNDHNYYTNSKSRLGSLCLLTEVALGKGSGAWNQSLIVSPGGWSHLSTHQCLSPRKIRKMPIWDEKGFESMLYLASTQEVMLHALSRQDCQGGYRKKYQECELWEQILKAMLELETGRWEDHINSIQNQGPGWHLRSSLRQEAQRRQT